MRFWQAILGLDRRVLYLILMILVGWQVIKPIGAENVVSKRTQDLYDLIKGMQEGDVVLIESDWTNSTRGESRGQFQALMRLLMRKKIKFIITSIDAQAVEVARNNIEEVAKEPGSNDYQEGRDYVIAGFFPNAENHVLGLVNNIRKELAPSKATQSAVMQNINDLSDLKAVFVVTASASINIWYQRMRSKTNLGLLCTAVMSAENIPYYASGQLTGIVIGAKGAYDFETLLHKDYKDEGFVNYGAGQRFMGPLAFALMLLVVAVVVGNIAMFVVRRGGTQ